MVKKKTERIGEFQYSFAGIGAQITKSYIGNDVEVRFEDGTLKRIDYSNYKTKHFAHPTLRFKGRGLASKDSSFGSFQSLNLPIGYLSLGKSFIYASVSIVDIETF